LVPQQKVGFPIPNAGLLLGFQGTKTARREGRSSPFRDAGGCTSPQNSGGSHSVGVAPQYASALGKTANCQTLVSLTLARDEVPVMIGLRLFLPESWTGAPDRMAKAHVPETWRAARTKPEIALAEIDRIRAAGVRFATVLADAGYGLSAPFRQGLDARGLKWAVGIPKQQKVYPSHVRLVFPIAGRGRPRKRQIPDQLSAPAEDVLATAKWRRVSWRKGTKGPLAASFAAVRVRIADGPPQRIHAKGMQHMPGEEAWLVGERRVSGERKSYLSNLPPDASLKTLAAAIKARWVCEQAHQQLKEELGLDHFEGRSWRGLHRHALMTMIAYAYLQSRRLAEANGRKTAKARPSRPCPRSGAPCSPFSLARRPIDVPIAGEPSQHASNKICQSSVNSCQSRLIRPYPRQGPCVLGERPQGHIAEREKAARTPYPCPVSSAPTTPPDVCGAVFRLARGFRFAPLPPLI
jgi:SRSO17 transposase